MSIVKKQATLTGLSDCLDEKTRHHLGRLYHFPELPSTNEWLLQNGHCRDVCLADKQSAGRGRNGRQWQSPVGNVYLSLRWCFTDTPAHYSWLSLMVGVAVSRAVEQCGLIGHRLKWPNDIFYENKKLAGILLQGSGALKTVIIGVGVNMQLDQHTRGQIDKPCCALVDYLPDLDRLTVVVAILQQLTQTLHAFPHESLASLQRQWQQWDLLVGQSVYVHEGQQQRQGVVQGLNTLGYLQVLHADEQIGSYSAADISVRL